MTNHGNIFGRSKYYIKIQSSIIKSTVKSKGKKLNLRNITRTKNFNIVKDL